MFRTFAVVRDGAFRPAASVCRHATTDSTGSNGKTSTGSDGRTGSANHSQNSSAPGTATKAHAAKPAPRLIYVQNPFTWVANKVRMKKLQYTWDRDFDEDEFKRGVKLATVSLTDHVRSNQMHEIQRITTPKGFVQIANDMLVSKDDPRIRMMHFRWDDIRRTIPVRVYQVVSDTQRRHCFIDMFSVGLRRAADMAPTDRAAFWQQLLRYDQSKWNASATGEPAVFAEMFVRFHRDYSADRSDDWNIAYYKVVSFDVLSL